MALLNSVLGFSQAQVQLSAGGPLVMSSGKNLLPRSFRLVAESILCGSGTEALFPH